MSTVPPALAPAPAFRPLRSPPAAAGYGPGDVCVVFGEVFGRGYVNGLLAQVRRAGMTVIGATVGRRDAAGALRPLDAGELAEAERNLGGRVVNVPLEAGFDLDPAQDGPSPADQLKAARPDAWKELSLDWDLVERSRRAGAARFDAAVDRFVAQITSSIPPGANVLFVHTMAGGFPRARVYMPLLNRVFRTTGARAIPSEEFWRTDLGRLWAASFEEVTGRTFQRLVAATAPLRTRVRRVRYVAYGYHGCEVLIGGEYAWQSYVPYLQGWAKLVLERSARAAWDEGVRCCVFNCPEIWTNSSSLFLGVEVSLYPFLRAVERECPAGIARDLRGRCEALLRDPGSIETLLSRADAYLGGTVMAGFRDLARWPQHSSPAQMDAMLGASEELLAMSADVRSPVCAELSRPVLDAVGRVMFDASWDPPAPVLWLGHDVLARRLAG